MWGGDAGVGGGQITNCQSCLQISNFLQSLDLHTFVGDVFPCTHTVKDIVQITFDVKQNLERKIT